MNMKKILTGTLSLILAVTTAFTTAYKVNAKTTDNITEDTVITYKECVMNFKNDQTRLYNFCDEMKTGIGNRTKQIAFVEMYFGIDAYVKDNGVYFKFYKNCRQDYSVSNTYPVSDKNKTALNVKNPMEYSRLDTSSLSDGLYKIEMTAIRTDKKTISTPAMYFYINNKKPYLCSYAVVNDSKINEAIERRETIDRLIKENGITPENSLGTESLCFPWHPSVGCNDIPEWEALADTIVKDEWSDSLKAFAIHEWMTKNLAYDYYKIDVIKDRRASYYGDYSGKHDTYETKTGVCFDFANIYAAMCRSVGIPAVTADTLTHTWNLIYIDGEWHEVDMTTDIRREVRSEDVTKVSNADEIHCYNGYCTLVVNDDDPETLNRWLWNYENSKYYR